VSSAARRFCGTGWADRTSLCRLCGAVYLCRRWWEALPEKRAFYSRSGVKHEPRACTECGALHPSPLGRGDVFRPSPLAPVAPAEAVDLFEFPQGSDRDPAAYPQVGEVKAVRAAVHLACSCLLDEGV
jgi:hypothetical protein